jgi:hypothetical protein
MQAAYSSSPGVLTRDAFIRQFERRFYSVTFLEKMKIDLQPFKQEKKSVTELKWALTRWSTLFLMWLTMSWRRRVSFVRA